MADSPETVMCFFRVIPEREDEFRKLTSEHEAVIRKLGLVSDEASQLYRGQNDDGRPWFAHIFSWTSADAVVRAHQHPEVAAIWERFDALCETRPGVGPMEFPHVEKLPL